MTRFIAIISGKGGVGKTTTAINLGTAFAKIGKEAIVLDGNLTMPNVGIYLGLANPPTTIHDVLEGKSSIKDATYLHASGLKIIPGSIKMNSLEKIDLNRIKNLHNKLKGMFETVLIDTGAGLTKETLSIMNMADEALIVTNPELAAVTDALRAIKQAEKQNITVLGIVLNKINPEGNELSIDNVETILGKPVIAAIPESVSVKQSHQMKHPVVYSEPRSIAALEFSRLVEKLK
jgi:septum site-determining protein MinD